MDWVTDREINQETLLLLSLTTASIIPIIQSQNPPPFPRPRQQQIIGPRPPRFNPPPNNRRAPLNFPVDPFARVTPVRQPNRPPNQQNNFQNQPLQQNNFQNQQNLLSNQPNNFQNQQNPLSNQPNNFQNQQNPLSNQPNNFQNQQNTLSNQPNNFQSQQNILSNQQNSFQNQQNTPSNQQNRIPNQINQQINFQDRPDQFSSPSSSINHVANVFNGQLKNAVWESQNDITSAVLLPSGQQLETSGGFIASRQIAPLNDAAVSTNQQAVVDQSARKKATLRDVIAEDCADAELLGYCASPPRYPTHQIELIIQRCADLIQLLYTPVPRDQEPDTVVPVTTRPANTTRSIERANRQIWSWARYSLEGGDRATVCPSTRHYVEPSYVKDVSSGRWYVVLQSQQRITQHVTVDKCHLPGEPCNQLECNSLKTTQCAQRYAYRHLVTWDPDQPEKCPKIKVFRFPTACVCQLV